jgi:hypothetical protein
LAEDAAVETDSFTNAVSLKLDDLIPDRTGAVVIQTDGQPLHVTLEEYDEVLARGIAAEGSQSEHLDVSGFDYISFSNGVVLYFLADEVRLVLGRKEQSPAPRPELPHPLGNLIERELDESGHQRPRPPKTTPHH